MYNDARRYKTREYIRNEMIREITRLWDYEEDGVALESFDPLIAMLLGAFATGLENVHHEIDNARTRIVKQLAGVLVPDVLTGAQPAHAVMRATIVDSQYEVTPDNAFSATVQGKECFFSSVGQYMLHKTKIATVIVQSRIKDMSGPTPKENFMNEMLPPNEIWIGLKLKKDDNDTEELTEFEGLSLFFDWRNDPGRYTHLNRLRDLRVFSEQDELQVTTGLVNRRPFDFESTSVNSQTTLENTIQHYYKNHFISINSRSRRTYRDIKLEKRKYPQEIAKMVSPEELVKFFIHDLFWLKLRFSGGLSPEVLSRLQIETNAFPVVNRRVFTPSAFELRPILNVFPVKVEEGDYFLGMLKVETQTGIEFNNVQQFTRTSPNQYLLRKGGITRFDERDAVEMISYVTDLLRDESAMFMALGKSELESDIEEIRKRLERITKDLRKDLIPPWYIHLKTNEKSGRVHMRFWTTKAEAANGIAWGTKLNRDRSNLAFTDELALLTTTTGGQNPIQDDEYLPKFRKVILTRGRIVTVEDYKAVCWAELGDKIQKVEIKKGFMVGPGQYDGVQQTLDICLWPNQNKGIAIEQWEEYKYQLLKSIEIQSSFFLPIRIIINHL